MKNYQVLTEDITSAVVWKTCLECPNYVRRISELVRQDQATYRRPDREQTMRF